VKRPAWLAFAVATVLAAVGAYPVCDLLFRCGCSWFSEAHCNIHQSAGAHCPWCAHRWPFPLVVASWLGATAIALRLSRRAIARHPLAALPIALAGLAAGMLASGALTVALTGYPHLLWW